AAEPDVISFDDYQDRTRELENLDDDHLLYALRTADERVVRMALAASGEGLWKRIAKRLPRRSAVRLRQEIFSIGPAKVSELREAQRALLDIAAARAA
ncbi:MAG: hypothetical protein KDA61_10985, partial [Planctomycetales bacterium]|nr:hypothetical protein [Planctomycetales bacterium]